MIDPNKLPPITSVHFAGESTVRDPRRGARGGATCRSVSLVGPENVGVELALSAHGVLIASAHTLLIQEIPWSQVLRIERMQPTAPPEKK